LWYVATIDIGGTLLTTDIDRPVKCPADDTLMLPMPSVFQLPRNSCVIIRLEDGKEMKLQAGDHACLGLTFIPLSQESDEEVERVAPLII
jgi:hypothetical protein